MISDADGDGIPDYRDDDDDNDCIPDHLDMDTEVPPIALRLVNGRKVKFNGEESLSILLSRLQEKEQESEQQNTLFSDIFSKAVKTISGSSDEKDDMPISPSRDDDDSGVSMFTSVFDSFKKSILEEGEDVDEHKSEDTEEDIDLWNILRSGFSSGDNAAPDSEGETVADEKPTVTEMISSFLSNIAKSLSGSPRQKGR